ncbi:hypothetical protein ASD81_16085 [Nocardioides sp. Root614]|nr:hypothetical protein ASD81_16085 [Nocardioides sp. Root614]KRA87636.1 hypothetical protein ASD84_16360 [Nocardioides sp. Root682]
MTQLLQYAWLRLAAVAAMLVCLLAAASGPVLAAPTPVQQTEVSPDDDGDVPATPEALMDKEARWVQYVNGLSVQRRAGTSTSGKTTRYSITASATRLNTFSYYKDWNCTRTWWTPNACGNYDARVGEFFAKALQTHHRDRAQIVGALGIDHLDRKNKMNVYQGKPFFLVNNLSTQQRATGTELTHTCLDVTDRLRELGELRLSGCQFNRAAPTALSPTDQVWRFRPGTGLVENVLLGGCLDVDGPAGSQFDGSPVRLGECTDADDPENADRQWGINPLGYLVNLASGRCLDIGADDATKTGTVPPRVTQCQYQYSPRPGSLGSSQGVNEEDGSTDQSWSLWYVDGGMDLFLPAPAPPT